MGFDLVQNFQRPTPRTRFVGPAGLVLAVLLTCTSAQAQGVAVTLRAGTMGPGIEATKSVGSGLNVRLGANYLPITVGGTYDDDAVGVRYDMDAKVQSVSLLLDWHPFVNELRLSTGLYYNGTEASGFVTAVGDYSMGNKTYTKEQLGTLSAELDYKSRIAPYLGIGIGNTVRSGKRVGFVFDIGAVYTSSLRLNMEGTGMISPTAEQDEQITDNLSGLTLWPVLSLGLSYKL